MFVGDWELMVFNGRSLKDFETMSFPIGQDVNEYGNVLFSNEINYDVNKMKKLFDKHVHMFNQDQKIVYYRIIQACSFEQVGFFFGKGYGGYR